MHRGRHGDRARRGRTRRTATRLRPNDGADRPSHRARLALAVARACALDRNGLRVFWVAPAAALVPPAGASSWASAPFRYHRFDLYTDFGTYAQAFSVIAHGHLDPFDTFQTYPVLAEPLRARDVADRPARVACGRTPIVLLWMQDAAVVATEVDRAALDRPDLRGAGGRAAADRRPDRPRRHRGQCVVVGGHHLRRPLRDLRHAVRGALRLRALAGPLPDGLGGRRRRACSSATSSPCRSSSSVLAGLLSARVRDRGRGSWHAAGLAAFGVAWLVLVTVLHGNRGSAVPIYYGYIVHEPSNASSWAVFGALAAHPAADLHVLRTHTGAHVAGRGDGGALGLLTPWGLLQALAVLVPVALNVNGSFWLLPVGAFQTVTAIPFVLVGTLMVLAWVGTGRPAMARAAPRPGRAPPDSPPWRGPAAWVLGAAALVLALSQSLPAVGPARLGLGHAPPS